MSRSLTLHALKCSLALLASCWLGLAALSAQPMGETAAASATSIGSTSTKVVHQAAVLPPVKTSEYALTAFAPGVFPGGLSNEGDVLLSDGSSLQRWKAGRVEALQIPEAGNFTVTGMNRNGAILGSSSRNANPGFSCLSTQKGWYWAPGQNLATEINNTFTYTGYDECANKNTAVRQFSPRVLDPANRIWADIPYEADPGNNSAFQGLHRWDAAGATPVQVGYHGPLPAGPYIELADVNSAGVMVGLRLRHGAGLYEYFVGEQVVSFYPFAINDAGDVLGYDGVSAVIRRGGVDTSLPLDYPEHLNSRGDVAGRFSGFPTLLLTRAGAGGTADYTLHFLQHLMPPGWTPLQITGLNDTGAVTGFGLYTDPAKPSEPAQILGFLLVPATLRVDFDRDGEINTANTADNPDRKLVREQMPWYFWVNDDNDANETDGNDIPGGDGNGLDGAVNGTRDLVDFFPVHLDIAGLLKAYPVSDPAITYKLAQADGAANFLTTDLKPATAGRYHNDAGFAKNLGGASVVQITATGVTMDAAFLGKILTDNQGVILVEARKSTIAPLRVEVWRDNSRVATVELPLSFAGVEQMFRHVNLTGAVGITPEVISRGGTPNWRDELNNKQAFLFVHGYNVDQQQARGWQAEFFKRLWWTGSNAQFWGVTWYGTESQKKIVNDHVTANYQANVIHAFGTAPYLSDFITTLRGPPNDPLTINVAGHSLGNMVVSSAISDHGAPVARYFMIDAAVAAEAYDGDRGDTNPNRVVQHDDDTATLPHTAWNKESAAVYPPRLWATNWHQLFQPLPNEERDNLTWRNRFAPKPGIEYYDFHSTGEEVLDFDSTQTPSLTLALTITAANKLGEYLHFTLPFGTGQPPGHRTWQLQEQLKGRTITGKVLGSNFGGWGFNTLFFKRSPSGPGGRGPVMTPAVLKPAEAEAILDSVFTQEALREEPFFRPGGDWRKVGSWRYDATARRNFWQEDRLGLLYGPATGSAFALTHRSALLARMIPAMSPPAGRIPVPALTPVNSPSRNFDMNGTTIRPIPEGATNLPWPQGRPTTNWWHSDLREVAFPYVKGLYKEITRAGQLTEQNTP